MSKRFVTAMSLLSVMIAVSVLLPVPIAGREQPGVATTGGETFRTPWGDPDLQGVWTGSTLTPLERPEKFVGKQRFTEEEAAAFEQQAAQARIDADDPSAPQRPGAQPTGTYNQVWFDPGTRLLPDRRTSLIVDPPDGRVPYTSEAMKRQGVQSQLRVNGPFHSWLDVDTGERCLGDGLTMIWFGYNPNHRFVQTPGYVVIEHEMFRDRRVIPLDGRPRSNIPQWNGESRGRWEGNTLVVETTNFADKVEDMRWANTWRAPSASMRLSERFTRVDADTMEYQFTLEDPSKFTRPWTAVIPLTTNQAERGVTVGQMYEYACHEGNYAIANILRGAREQGGQE